MDKMETTIQACKAIEHGWIELNNRMAVLSAELQQLDKVRSDILHHIENTRFRKNQNFFVRLVESYKLIMALEELSIKRRAIKDEMGVIHSFASNLNTKHMATEYKERFSRAVDRAKEKDGLIGTEVYKSKEIDLEEDILTQVRNILKEIK